MACSETTDRENSDSPHSSSGSCFLQPCVSFTFCQIQTRRIQGKWLQILHHRETWRTASLSKHLRGRTPNPCHPDTWLHVRWRRWVLPFYPHTSWRPPWRSFPSSYLSPSVWLGAETVPGGHETPASRPSRWLLQRSPKWRRKGLRLWRKKGRDCPSFSRWRASGEAHRLCTTQDPCRAAAPRLHRLVWTPVTQTRHNKRVRGRSEGWQDWNSMYFADIFLLNSSFTDFNLQ